MNIVKNTSFKVKSPYGYDDFKGVKKTTVPYYFKIILDDGSEFKGSEGHLVQLNEGSFFEISQLIEGDILSNGKTVVGVEGIEEELEVYDLLHVDNESSCYEDVNGIIHHNCAFINDIDEIFTSAQQTLACVYDNSIITTNKGLKRIKSLYDDPEEGFNPFYEGVYNINNDKVWSSHFYKSPKSKTLKITFDNGNYIICTQEHPILHRSGEWIKANDIKKGDTIKGYYNHNTHGDPIKYNYSHDMTNEDIAYCMGQWYLRGKSYYGVQFYKPSGDSALWYIDRGFFIMKKKYYTYKGDRAKDIIKVWKEAFNFKEEKKVSDTIMSASRSEYLAFLRGVLQSNPKSSHKNIILTFHSEQFVKDIQLMMMNIGIQTKIFRYSYRLYQLACSDESLELIKRIIYNEEIIDNAPKEYYCRVTNIEIGDTIETYDLKVPDGESFLSDGIINHNTGGKCIALSCVADDTYIRTNTGIKQMKSLIDYTRKDGEGYEINEYEVLGYGGSRKGNLIKNNGLVKTYILDTGYSKPLECSFNHKLWVYDNDTKEYRWKEAQHITKEDYLALNVGGDIWGNFEFPKITFDLSYSLGRWLKNDIIIDSKNFEEFLLDLGLDINSTIVNRSLSEKIMSFNRENVISLLQGIFNETSISSPSKELIYQINILLNNLGIVSCIDEEELYSLTIPKEETDKFRHIVWFNSYLEKNIDEIDSIRWVNIRDIKESKNYTYDLSLPDNGGFWDHSVIYNNLIGHQTPNGVGNWFHKTWQKAEIGDNSFVPIRLPWTVHPERDQSWRDQQDKDLGSRKAAQECDTVFESSGDTVFENVDIEWYEKNVLDPIERKGINNPLWVWEYPDYSRSYMVCLPVGEKVLTSEGIKSIEDITYENYLIDENGEPTEILDIKERIYEGDIYEITPFNTCRTTKFTDEHPILISKDKKEITYFKNNNIWRRRENKTFDFNFVPSKDVNVGDWIKYPNIYKNKPISDQQLLGKFAEYFDKGRIDFHLNPEIILEKDFWWYVGIWLAEGWVTSSKEGIKTIETAHDINETHIHDKISGIIENTFQRKSTHTLRVKENTQTIKFSSKGLGTFLINTFGRGALNKHVPEWVKYLPDDLKIQLISGYLEGDGCMVKSPKGNFFSFVSVSLDLLEGIQDILFSLGIISTLRKLHSERKCVIKDIERNGLKSYQLRLGFFDTNILMDKLSFLEGKEWKSSKNNFNENINIRRYSKGCKLSEDNMWIYFRINKIKKYEYKGIVYNFTTKSGTFLCENITTHNCADVSRGDGKDYSAFHVIDMESLVQVAEYKDQIGTREYGNLLVSVATEYNDALLVVENNNVGWDVVNTVIDRGYKNLYYSSKKDEISATDWVYRESTNDMIPGFSVTSKNRPLIITKLLEYIGDHICIIRSKRLVDEMRVFIWKNGKAQAQEGYNDDLIMSYGTALYLRDNALRFREQKLNSTVSNINSFSVEKGNMNIASSFMGGTHNRGNVSWVMNVRGNEENINWLLE